MTEFRGITSGQTITTKNNINNVAVGNKIEIDENNGETKIVGIVKDVIHLVSKLRNHQGLSTHEYNHKNKIVMTDKDREEYLKHSNVYNSQEDHPLAYKVWLRMHYGF